VSVKNINAGHHYPTGNPMRNMILLVKATDEKGQMLSMSKGDKVPVWGGVGPIESGNYAGLPGKGFAKVLKDISIYPDRKKGRDFKTIYPSPHWRPAVIESDNRIPADGIDTSTYQFHAAENRSGPIFITTKLIFRRTYKNWSDVKGLNIPDLEIANNNLTIRIMR